MARRRHAKLNQAASLRASAKGGGLSAAGHAGYSGMHGGMGGTMGANPTGVYQSEAEKLGLERRLLTENRRVLELEEELDRQLTREQRMKRQLERLRQQEEMNHHRPGTGAPTNYPMGPAGAMPMGGGPMDGMGMQPQQGGDPRMYDQAVSMANLRSALAVQQAEIEDLQRVKREMREQIGMEREMGKLNGMEAQQMQMLGHGTPYHPVGAGTGGMGGGMAGQYPGGGSMMGGPMMGQQGGPMGQQQTLHTMQSENQRMMNELQRIRQVGGGAMGGAMPIPAGGVPMGGMQGAGGYPMPAYAHGAQGYPMAGQAAGGSHIALQQMEAQLTAQLQWIGQQKKVGAYAGVPMGGGMPMGGMPMGQHPMMAGAPMAAPVGPMRQASMVGPVDGNMQVTVTPGGTMPARYATRATGVSAIDPETGTRNWRVQGGLASAGMAEEGKKKVGKLSRKVAWVEGSQQGTQEIGQDYQVGRIQHSKEMLMTENQTKQRQLEQMERELLALHDL